MVIATGGLASTAFASPAPRTALCGLHLVDWDLQIDGTRLQCWSEQAPIGSSIHGSAPIV